MSQYDELDARILAAIELRKNPLYASHVSEEAKRLAQATGREDYRVVDGRLQALRRKGRIEHLSKTEGHGKAGWQLVPTAD